MANAITIVETWTTEHVAKVFLKPILATEEIVSTYGIDPTVNRSKTIYMANELSRILKKKNGCDFDADGSFALGEKTIDTQPVAVNLEQCAAEFYDTVFKHNLKRGSDIYDLSGTVIEEVLVSRVTETIRNDVFELCWFGNTGHSTSFFQTFDGWFKLFNDNLPGANKVSVGTTGDLDADQAMDVMRTIYKTSNQLRTVNPTEKVFMVTDTIYCNLLDTFENKALDSGLARLAEGGPLTFRGVPVEPQLMWDSSIADQGIGNPHRIVYTKRENLIIGTDIKNPGSDAKLFLDELTEKFYFKANFDLGVQYLFDEYVVCAD